MNQSSDNTKPTKKPLSDGAKVALILGGAALLVLLIAIICFYSFLNNYLDTYREDTSGFTYEDLLSDEYEQLEFSAGTYKVPDDIEIATYIIIADKEMQFIATGADGEIDIEKKLNASESINEDTLCVTTEEGDTIQLIGDGKVSFIKIGEAEDFIPSNNDHENKEHKDNQNNSADDFI